MALFWNKSHKNDGVAAKRRLRKVPKEYSNPIYCVVPTRGINGFLTDLRYTICITEALSKIPFMPPEGTPRSLTPFAYLYPKGISCGAYIEFSKSTLSHLAGCSDFLRESQKSSKNK